MPTILFGIALAALLSATSLLVVVLRVSPLLAPAQALSAFFVSVFLTVSTIGTLLLLIIWKYVPHHGWDMGKMTGICLRQGIFLGAATTVLLLFHVLDLLTWWVALMIYGVFALVEAALKIGIHFGGCQHTDSGTPWGLLITGSLLVAPKMVGRATAGSVWRAIGDRIAGRPTSPPPADPPAGTADG